jgi:hypothetical protein
MARQKGILKIEGTIGGMTFYKTKDGHLVKEKSSISADKIANDPAFQRTRENGKEFGNAGSAGKVLRDAIRTLMLTASDGRVTSRLTQVMTDVLKQDLTSLRGERTVAIGIGTPEGKALLVGFDFNILASLGGILFKSFALDTATGVITINNIVPLNDIDFPIGATHFTVKGAFAKVDFANGVSAVEYTNVINLPIDATSTNVVLTPASVPASAATSIYLLQIEFFQEVNGVQYTLKNGAYNALTIIEVA